MNQNTREQMVSVVQALCTAFGKQADEPMYLAFEYGLDGLSAKQIQAAAARALRTSKFMPTPAELRELSGEVTAKSRAVIAWEAVSKSAASGFYDTVDFDDPVVNAAIRNIGGWEYLTTLEDSREFESHVRRRFEAAYVALYERGISSDQAGPLIGYHDRMNALQGFAPQNVKRIATNLPPARVRIGSSEGPKKIGEAMKSVGVDDSSLVKKA